MGSRSFKRSFSAIGKLVYELLEFNFQFTFRYFVDEVVRHVGQSC